MTDRSLLLAHNGRTAAIRESAARQFAGRLDFRALPLQTRLQNFFGRLAQREIREAVNRVAHLFRDQRAITRTQALPKVQKALSPIRKELDEEDTERLIEIVNAFGVRRLNDAGATVALANNSTWENVPTLATDFLESKEIHLRNLMEDAREEFQEIIAQHIADSLVAEPRGTIAQLSRSLYQRLAETGGPFSPERAMLIARTETAQAENFGIHEGMRVSGISEIKWVAITDNRVRDSHRFMHGKKRRLDGPWFKLPSGVQMRYPADSEAKGPRKAVAAELIRCRCVQTPVK